MTNKKYLPYQFIILVLFVFVKSQAQTESVKFLADNVVEGKFYVLSKATEDGQNSFNEKKGFYIKLLPPVYKTVVDTVVLQPALNADMDTSNYFIETEVVQVKEASAEWKTANVSSHCSANAQKPYLALSLQKISPDYEIFNRKFFPYKNILDVEDAENVIAAVTMSIEKKILVQRARLETYPLTEKPLLLAGEKLLEIPAGIWQNWMELKCPGEFLDPKIDEIQLSLKNKGYKVEITNVLDKQTIKAVYEFQADNNMETDGLTDETVKLLGVERERLIILE
jgi:hypothetical protein